MQAGIECITATTTLCIEGIYGAHMRYARIHGSSTPVHILQVYANLLATKTAVQQYDVVVVKNIYSIGYYCVQAKVLPTSRRCSYDECILYCVYLLSYI